MMDIPETAGETLSRMSPESEPETFLLTEEEDEEEDGEEDAEDEEDGSGDVVAPEGTGLAMLNETVAEASSPPRKRRGARETNGRLYLATGTLGADRSPGQAKSLELGQGYPGTGRKARELARTSRSREEAREGKPGGVARAVTPVTRTSITPVRAQVVDSKLAAEAPKGPFGDVKTSSAAFGPAVNFDKFYGLKGQRSGPTLEDHLGHSGKSGSRVGADFQAAREDRFRLPALEEGQVLRKREGVMEGIFPSLRRQELEPDVNLESTQGISLNPAGLDRPAPDANLDGAQGIGVSPGWHRRGPDANLDADLDVPRGIADPPLTMINQEQDLDDMSLGATQRVPGLIRPRPGLLGDEEPEAPSDEALDVSKDPAGRRADQKERWTYGEAEAFPNEPSVSGRKEFLKERRVTGSSEAPFLEKQSDSGRQEEEILKERSVIRGNEKAFSREQSGFGGKEEGFLKERRVSVGKEQSTKMGALGGPVNPDYAYGVGRQGETLYGSEEPGIAVQKPHWIPHYSDTSDDALDTLMAWLHKKVALNHAQGGPAGTAAM